MLLIIVLSFLPLVAYVATEGTFDFKIDLGDTLPAKIANNGTKLDVLNRTIQATRNLSPPIGNANASSGFDCKIAYEDQPVDLGRWTHYLYYYICELPTGEQLQCVGRSASPNRNDNAGGMSCRWLPKP